LAISHDGINWHPIYQLENTLNDEFSYPDIQINGDIIDVMYTNNRKNIKHVRFNRAWLNEVVANAK
jgi:predicted neuraminidase